MLIDTHSHILPGIDDGARTVEDSLDLIRAELANGVNTIFLTPHFYPGRMHREEFFKRQEAGYEKLCRAVDEAGLPVELLLGAEVHFSPLLLKMDLDNFRMGDSDYLLIELPMEMCPPNLTEMLSELTLRHYHLVMAHVERYPYLRDGKLLYEWAKLGYLSQVSVSSVLENGTARSFVEACIRHDLIHVMGSDAHSMAKRPPRMKEAICLMQKRVDTELLRRMNRFAQGILENRPLLPENPTPIRKKLWQYE